MVERTDKGILIAPNQPLNIPQNAHWLAGQGAGSWYHITKEETDTYYSISRFSPNGDIEFESQFKINSTHEFCIDCPYAFTYLSHFKSCNILQHGVQFNFVNISR